MAWDPVLEGWDPVLERETPQKLDFDGSKFVLFHWFHHTCHKIVLGIRIESHSCRIRSQPTFRSGCRLGTRFCAVLGSTTFLQGAVTRPSGGVRQQTGTSGVARLPELCDKIDPKGIGSQTKKLEQKSTNFCIKSENDLV